MLALLYGFFRAGHGSGFLPRIVALLLMTFYTWLYFQLSLTDTIVLFAGLALGLCPGWDKYWPCTGCSPYNRDEKGFTATIIDPFVLWIKNDTLSATLGMSLRWTLFFLPLFIVAGKWYLAFLLMLIGPLYWTWRFYKNWTITEFITGAWLGVAITLIYMSDIYAYFTY